MNLLAIRNNTLRRTALVSLLIPCAIWGVLVVLYQAAREYVDAFRGAPEDFKRIWRGE